MKTITLTRPVSELLELLEQAGQEDIIVRLTDGREFVLAALEDFDYEIAQTRKQTAIMALLDERAKEPATIALDDLKTELGLEE